MAIKKSDLYSSLWASCNELRGGIPERDIDAPDNARLLAERYATPLPQLVDEVATLAARVDDHLKKMGFQS